jgi:hypothetical protein
MDNAKQYKMYFQNENWGYVWMTNEELLKIKIKALEQGIRYVAVETEKLEHLSSPNGCLEGCPACEAE